MLPVYKKTPLIIYQNSSTLFTAVDYLSGERGKWCPRYARQNPRDGYMGCKTNMISYKVDFLLATNF
jgi:hypothetical protein